ncbi:MAG: hypothetical protein ACRBBO_06865 [Cognatishimia sp.]
MLRNFLLSFFICTATVAQSEPINRESLLELILANDIDQVETKLIEAQAAYASGDVEGEHIRELNRIFDTASPTISDFTDEWIKAYPNSAHAYIASSWIANRVAWNQRGGNYVRGVYPAAWKGFREEIQKSANHAVHAYQLDPQLLPVTDSLIWHGIMRTANVSHDQLVQDLMEANPEGGTLIRALRAAYPGWGGTQDYGNRLCETHAPKVIAWGKDAIAICKLHLSAEYFSREPAKWFAQTLSEIDHPAVADIRRKTMVYLLHTPQLKKHLMKLGLPNEAWNQDLAELFSDPDYTDLEFAQHHDLYYTLLNPEAPLATPQVLPRAWNWAMRTIAYDPNNIKAVEALLTRYVFTWEGSDGRHVQSAKVAPPENAPSVADLVVRLVKAEPWNADYWQNVSSHIENGSFVPKTFEKSVKAAINSLEFSQYDELKLQAFIQHFSAALDYLERRQGKSSGSEKAVLEALDLDELLRCPLARASLILKHKCQNPDPHSPNREVACHEFADLQRHTLERVFERFSGSKACVATYAKDIEELKFSPFDIEFLDAE